MLYAFHSGWGYDESLDRIHPTDNSSTILILDDSIVLPSTMFTLLVFSDLSFKIEKYSEKKEIYGTARDRTSHNVRIKIHSETKVPHVHQQMASLL
jgi:hypothetical protein